MFWTAADPDLLVIYQLFIVKFPNPDQIPGKKPKRFFRKI